MMKEEEEGCGSDKKLKTEGECEEEQEEGEVMGKRPPKLARLKCHVAVQQEFNGDLAKKTLERLTSALPKILVEDLAPFLQGQKTCIRINELPRRFLCGISNSWSQIEQSEIHVENGVSLLSSDHEDMDTDSEQKETEIQLPVTSETTPKSVPIPMELDLESLEDRFAVEPEEVITLEELLAEEMIKVADTNVPELPPGQVTTSTAITSTSRSQQQLKEARQNLAQTSIGKSRRMKRRLYYTDARYRKSRKLLQTSRTSQSSDQSSQGPGGQIGPAGQEETDPGQEDTDPGGQEETDPGGQEEKIDLTCEPLDPSGPSRNSPTKSETSLPDCNQNSIVLSIEETNLEETKGVEDSQDSSSSSSVTKVTETVEGSNRKSEFKLSTTTTGLEELAASSCSRPKRQIQRPRRLLEAFVSPTIRATKVVKKPLLIPPLTLKKEEEVNPEVKEEEEEEEEDTLETVDQNNSSRSPSSSPARPEFSPIKTPVKIPSPASTETPKEASVPNNLEPSRTLYSLEPKKRRRRQPVMASRCSPVLCVHENLEIGMFYLIAQEGNRMQVMRFNGTTMEPLDLGWVDTIRANAAESSSGMKPESNRLVNQQAEEDMQGQDEGEEAILDADPNLTAAA